MGKIKEINANQHFDAFLTFQKQQKAICLPYPIVVYNYE
jgi:hypothetical protein